LNEPEKQAEPAIVSFDGPDDPENPHNWSGLKKARVMGIISLVAFIVGFGSSIDSGVLPQASRHFGVSSVTESLATALYLIGFGCGAPFAGPLSEERGRTPVYLITFTLYCCWILGAALAPNIGAQLVFRFLAGTCGSTPFTVAGGTLGDIFDHHQRGKLFPFFACIAFLGPMLSPAVGAYIGHSGMDWRWAEWITFIISCGILALMVLFLPETDAKEILRWKTQALRSKGANVQAPPKIPIQKKLATALTRPFIILFTQPIIALFTGYLTLVYSVAFCFFSSARKLPSFARPHAGLHERPVWPSLFWDRLTLSQQRTYLERHTASAKVLRASCL
jgi:MFS family permease